MISNMSLISAIFNTMKISVIILDHNQSENLDLILSSIDRQKQFVSEVIIVSNGIVLPGIDLIDKYKDKFTLITKGIDSPNRSAGRNAGIESATGDIVLFIDGDIVLSYSYLRNLILYHQEYDRSLIHGLVIYEKSRNEVVKNIILPLSGRNKDVFGNFEVMCSNNLSIRKKYLLTFDENFIGYGAEDMDYAYRAQKKNIKLIATDNLYCFHINHPHPEADKIQIKINEEWLAKKHPDMAAYRYKFWDQLKLKNYNRISQTRFDQLIEKINNMALKEFGIHLDIEKLKIIIKRLSMVSVHEG